MGTTEDAEYTERMRERVAGGWCSAVRDWAVEGASEKFSEAPGMGQ